MPRWNSEGIPREQLIWVLRERPDLIQAARLIDSCLLCRGSRVNEAALCPICWAILDEPELTAAQAWLTGNHP